MIRLRSNAAALGLAALAILAFSHSASALPTKREVAAARTDVESVLSSTLKLHRSGKMDPERFAKMLLLLAQGEEDEARRFLYLQGTVVAAVEAHDVPLAAQALARLRDDIADMTPEVEGQVLDLALRKAPKGRAARLRLDILRRLESPVLKVATYNIRYAEPADGENAWTNRCDALVGLLKRQNLDVFGLQEVLPAQAAFLRAALPAFGFAGEHRNADRTSGEASPVFYRKDRYDPEKSGTFWLSPTPDVPGVKGWGAACPRVCSYAVLRDRVTGRRFCFANTHTDHVSAEAREKGMLLVVARMRAFGAGAPVVFVGDHNCAETEAPAKAVSAVLTNALYATETPPAGSWRTWNGWRWREKEVSAAEALAMTPAARNDLPQTSAGYATDGAADTSFWSRCGGPRIDYIYVSREVRVLDYATVSDPCPGAKRYPSDHFPVVATVSLEAK